MMLMLLALFAQDSFKQEELDQILAPIALYPDDLLAQTLMAATYPIEVVQAQRWADTNKSLKGDALAKELEKQGWDPSVKSLVNFPQVLQMMSEKLDWTVKLGDAFLGQKKEVMDTVQKLRQKAKEAGNLKTDDKQTVSNETPIVITASSPTVIYVPVYDPVIIYGTWWYPAYPPYSWYPPYYTPRPGIWFGVGFTLGVAWGYGWGHCHWGHGDIDIDINKNIHLNTHINRTEIQAKMNRDGAGKSWKHDPAHRQGTPYKDAKSRETFDRRPDPSREAFRGRETSPTRDLRPTPLQRPDVSRPAERPQFQRPSGFDGLRDGGSRVQMDRSRGMQSRRGGGGFRGRR